MFCQDIFNTILAGACGVPRQTAKSLLGEVPAAIYKQIRPGAVAGVDLFGLVTKMV
jgi:hypothetical protein